MERMTDEDITKLTRNSTETQLAHAMLYAIGAANAAKHPIVGESQDKPWEIICMAMRYVTGEE